MEKEKINKITITGTLVENKLREGVAKNGKNTGKSYISGEIIVKSVIDGKDNLFPIRLYAFEQTKEGKENKLYASYRDLQKLLNRRITVSGTFSENRFWSEKTGQIASQQVLNGRFINEAKAGTPDGATYDFSGYVAKELVEKTNKENEIYAYELLVGQTNYTETEASFYRFHIDPSRTDIINSVRELYVTGSTVHFSGEIRYVSENITKETTAVAFGSPQARNFVVTNRNYFITGGESPITGESAYDMEDMLAYKKANQAKDIEIQNKAKASGGVSTAGVLKTKATSLL